MKATHIGVLSMIAMIFWACKAGTDGQLSDEVNPTGGATELQLGYDPGPDPNDPVGKGYIDLMNEVPDFTYLGRALNGGYDKFRFPFGIMPWRGPMRKNSVKVLVIGQDGTHIAEAAGRPFTGGTGGRVQGALRYIGIQDAAMFMNTYAFTIKGQYADYAPILSRGKVRWQQILSPEGYLLGQHECSQWNRAGECIDSPIVEWRNKFIDHVLDSNRDSLKLIFCIGGAARDTMATYINSRGGQVLPRYDNDPETDNGNIGDFQAVLYGRTSAGGNRSFFYPLNKSTFKNALLNSPRERPNYRDEGVQLEHMRTRAPAAIDQFAKMSNGDFDNGIFQPGQLGYEMNRFTVAGRPNTLRGLKVNGKNLRKDVRILMFRHPGSLSDRLQADFQASFDRMTDNNWTYPETDSGLPNRHLAGEPFVYDAKADIPDKDFPLGKTKAVIVKSSLASRSGKQVIVFGGRNRVDFGESVNKAKKGRPMPSELKRLMKTQPWNPPVTKGAFDRGPGVEWADVLSKIPLDKVFVSSRTGETMSRCGRSSRISELPVKSCPEHGAFGFYRGNVTDPKVLVLADPSDDDLDDMYSARALTGGLGQKLQGFMNSIKVGDNYLVVKTLPFDMHMATPDEWNTALEVTHTWRQEVLQYAVGTEPKLILLLGSHASKLFTPEGGLEGIETGQIPVISMEGGWSAAFRKVKALPHFTGLASRFRTTHRSIPRSHLPYPLQAWVGTSGMGGVRARGEAKGLYYGIVAPDWVVETAAEEERPLENEKAYIKWAADAVKAQGFARLGYTSMRYGGGGRPVDTGAIDVARNYDDELERDTAFGYDLDKYYKALNAETW